MEKESWKKGKKKERKNGNFHLRGLRERETEMRGEEREEYDGGDGREERHGAAKNDHQVSRLLFYATYARVCVYVHVRSYVRPRV